MYLRDLAVFASPSVPASGLTTIFNVSTHVVVEPVLAWIPRNKVVLDDLAKLNVEVGGSETPESRYSKALGVGTFCVTEFGFEDYGDLTDAAQQELILELLDRAFRHVAEQSDSDASLCFDAVRRVRAWGLPLPRLNSREFWHALPAHKRRAKSFRQSVEFTAAIVDRAQRARQTASRTRVKKRGR
jgi:hypothetical protein